MRKVFGFSLKKEAQMSVRWAKWTCPKGKEPQCLSICSPGQHRTHCRRRMSHLLPASAGEGGKGTPALGWSGTPLWPAESWNTPWFLQLENYSYNLPSWRGGSNLLCSRLLLLQLQGSATLCEQWTGLEVCIYCVLFSQVLCDPNLFIRSYSISFALFSWTLFSTFLRFCLRREAMRIFP